MNETFMLYLFTRLDSFNRVLVVGGVFLLIGTVITVIVAIGLKTDGDEYPKIFHRIWAAFALIVLFNIVVPTQKDVALILAGSTIMSIARTDEAQRITSKSVRVVEQYLDALLIKEKK
jgi:chromate transport protein ChrA